MLEKVNIIITLIAALTVTIVCLVTKAEFMDFTLKLCVTIVLFYFIGCYMKGYLSRKVFKNKQEFYLEDDIPPSEAIETQK